ncbi:hypothetical protein A1O3_05944 [Capronia epimyces CBS 606.96]|uniref:Extracellular membrane protein CFEM domain-containing protein n=1 Tax=Capronia epimyces CBS 606.96 TaxID=1182542 RepID=W9YSK4_9EURO|nr:uncharacterized protein A1O3_05944 [Capronia epimyces CBS 606.96]EXJ85269.1 hypothetical protein A1O3_05944 [Capronia epimyces CBS 606.96]
MHSKPLFFSAILAEISLSLATERADGSSVNAVDCNPLTSAACLTGGAIHGPFPLQQVLAYPNVRAGVLERTAEAEPVCFISNTQACDDVQAFAHCLTVPTSAGETCILNPGCTIRLIECPSDALPFKETAGEPPLYPDPSPRDPKSTSSFAPAPSPKLELKDQMPELFGASRSKSIAEEVDAAMPDSVKEAVLNQDSEIAAQALAKELSGNPLPQWYENMPASVKNYYATITTPPMMSVMATDEPTVSANNHRIVRRSDPTVDAWVSSIKSYESQISALSMAARSHSRNAKALSIDARSNSRRATSEGNTELQTTASLQSVMAQSLSQQAVSESRVAQSASKAAYAVTDKPSTASAAIARYANVAWYSGTLGAVACLLMALVL